MIPYTIETIFDEHEPVSYVFHFKEEQELLEEFFFGDVSNFAGAIRAYLEGRDNENKRFVGNVCSIYTNGTSTEINSLFTEATLSVKTEDLLKTVCDYIAYGDKMKRECKEC